MSKELKFNKLKFALTEQNFTLNLDNSALYETNATEFYKAAVIGTDSVRNRFRLITGVKDRVKVGTVVVDSLIKTGDCDYNPSDSTASQKTYVVCPLMFGQSICVEQLEAAFISDEIAKGSNNFTEPQPFMNYFYQVVSEKAQEELALISFQGDTSNPAFSGTSAYLKTCDGLEVKLLASTGTTKAASATTVTSTNIILKLQEARSKVGAAVRKKSDFVYIVSTNVYDAIMDAYSENKMTGIYYYEGPENNVLRFQGVEVVRADEASDNLIIAGALSNFLNITDLESDSQNFNIVDFMKSTLSRKIGIRSDFKLSIDFLVDEEIFIHLP